MKPEPEMKIGTGHAAAMFRQGLRELRAAVYPESNIAQQPDYGLAGNLTPGEIAQARENSAHNLEQERPRDSILESRMRQSEQRTPARESREPVMDR